MSMYGMLAFQVGSEGPSVAETLQWHGRRGCWVAWFRRCWRHPQPCAFPPVPVPRGGKAPWCARPLHRPGKRQSAAPHGGSRIHIQCLCVNHGLIASRARKLVKRPQSLSPHVRKPGPFCQVVELRVFREPGEGLGFFASSPGASRSRQLLLQI